MSAKPKLSYRDLLKSAYDRIEALETERDALRNESIAVIGLGCRFPGDVDSPAAFWRLLRDGVDAITEVPPERWDLETYYDPDPETPGKMYTRYGGFLSDVDTFDAPFFNLSPREMTSLDPQQRLLLEVSWEALEHANLVPSSLYKTPVGVFVGICTYDYERVLERNVSLDDIDAYFGTGNSRSAASGRLSYVLGVTGPSIAIDTACSSSLVTVHLACRSLRQRECNLALVGGVNLTLAPEPTINFCKARMMAPDGRCKTFDAAADGYVRGEGCGVVVLKRLNDARRDGDNILAVIRGSAMNQDGPSSGLTVPNGRAQERVIRQALELGGIEPQQVGYIEAHGTGTALGDPIEVEALGSVFGPGREHPLLIGSVKTNLGHLEGAAGIASLIKSVLILQHGQIPPHLHFSQPSPYISWDRLPINVPTQITPWPSLPDGNERRIAGISAFGFSGTNVHVVLEKTISNEQLVINNLQPFDGALRQAQDATQDRSPISNLQSPISNYHLLTLSAKTEKALTDLAGRYQTYLADHPQSNVANICYTTNIGREHFKHRLAVVAESTEQLREKLAAFVEGDQPSSLLQARAAERPKIAFLFTGQGSQYLGMGQELYQTQPVFRQTLDRCAEILRPYLKQSLLDVLYPDLNKSKIQNPKSKIDDTAITQPALFALEYALAELWKSWGITPDVVMGHSVGELVAACAAGVFSLEDGLKLAAERGRLMQATEAGEMVVVFASEAACAALIEPYTQDVSIAAINGPETIVISGRSAAIHEIVEHLNKQGVKTHPLVVSHAFHSPLMKPALSPFAQVAEGVTYAAPRIDLISNLTGKAMTTLSAGHWVDHIRQPVRFADGLRTLRTLDVDLVIEVGPKPTLLGLAGAILSDDVSLVPSLRQGRAETQQMLQSLGQLHVQGASIKWKGVWGSMPAGRIPLPTYPWQRERYWVEIAPRSAPLTHSTHPLLGQRLRLPFTRQIRFETEFSPHVPAHLAEHRLFDRVVISAATYLAMLLAAAQEAFHVDACTLEDVLFAQALTLADREQRSVQLILTPEEMASAMPSGPIAFQIISLVSEDSSTVEMDEETAWTVHTTGNLNLDTVAPAHKTNEIKDIQARCPQTGSGAEFYTRLAETGYNFGPSFRRIEQFWHGEGEALCALQPPPLPADRLAYLLHPGLIDACLQSFAICLSHQIQGDVDDGTLYVPFNITRFRFYGTPQPASRLWCHALDRTSLNGDIVTGSIRLVNDDGHLIADFEGVEFRRLNFNSMQTSEATSNWLYEVTWRPQVLFGAPPDYLPTPGQINQELAPQLAALNSQPVLALYREGLAQFESLSLIYIQQAFQQMGVFEKTRFSTSQLIEDLGVTHLRLFEHLLSVVTSKTGLLARIETDWEVKKVPEKQAVTGAFLAEQYPMMSAELTLLTRCGEQLADILQGRVDPLQLLFPAGDLTMVTNLYQNAPGAQLINNVIKKTLHKTLKQLPPGRGVRIVELGAGTGSTTASLLPVLPLDQTDYLFTDLSSFFTAKAEEKFKDYDFVRYDLLDIEQEPTAAYQHQFDVVIAANVLHATKNLRQTLKHVWQLLAPGGILILLEGTIRQTWVDLIFGLTEGWWRFTDTDLRPDYPLLPAQQWQKLLQSSGFKEAINVTPAEIVEQAIIVAQAEETTQARNWLILADNSGLGEQVAGQLSKKGESPTLVFAGDSYKQTGHQTIINPTSAADYNRLCQTRWHGVVHLWSLDTCSETIDLDVANRRGSGSTLHLIQALAQADQSPHVWLVTRGTQAVVEPMTPGAISAAGVAQSPLWGLGRVLANEHPDLRCVRIDLAPQRNDNEGTLLLNEVLATTGEPVENQVAFRDMTRYAARLTPTEAPSNGHQLRFRDDGTYLITGGLGGLGLLVARWLVEHGARRLVLVGRSTDKPGVQAQLRALEQAQAQVIVAQADISKRTELARILSEIGPEQPLRGIVHAAGVLDDGILLQQTWDRFETVFAPKVQGSWHLHTLTQDLPLDFFVLFSSAANLLGSPGQANHAAANAFLDTLAHHRHGLGLPALSINWGVWAEVGAAAERNVPARIDIEEMGLIKPQQGLQVLGRILGSQSAPQVGVIPLNYARFGPDRFRSLMVNLPGIMPFMTELVPNVPSSPAEKSQILKQLEAAPLDERKALLIEHVRTQIAQVLRSRQPIFLSQGFFDLGMDSLTAMELRNRLQSTLNCNLSPTLAFKYSTVGALVDYLAEEVLALPAAEPGARIDETVGVKQADQTALADLSDDELEALLADELVTITKEKGE